MGEVVNVVVAVAVIVFIVRWATTFKATPAERSINAALGFRTKNVTQEMVDNVHNAFPHIPPDNIRYDLLRTGSTEITSHNILEKGFLEAPPAAYYDVFPRNEQPVTQNNNNNTTNASAASNIKSKSKQPTLISRFSLENRLGDDSDVPDAPEVAAGGKGTWQDSKEMREKALREKKEKMILAARKQMLVQQQKEVEMKSSAVATGVSTLVS